MDDGRKLARTDPRRRQYGARLRAAREAQGLTQEAAAARLGLSRSALGDLETGRRLESWPAFLAMVQAMGYDPAIVAPELVDTRPLVSQTRCPSTDVKQDSAPTPGRPETAQVGDVKRRRTRRAT